MQKEALLMPCEERARLAAIYIAAVAKNNESGSAIAEAYHERRSDAWHETKATHAACQEALSALDQHIFEHGC